MSLDCSYNGFERIKNINKRGEHYFASFFHRFLIICSFCLKIGGGIVYFSSLFCMSNLYNPEFFLLALFILALEDTDNFSDVLRSVYFKLIPRDLADFEFFESENCWPNFPFSCSF